MSTGRTSMNIPNTKILLEIFCEDGKIGWEVLDQTVFIPELILNLQKNFRPIQDWYNESLTEELICNIKFILPPNFEIYEDDTIIYEVIGILDIIGNYSHYDNEYDEDIDFKIIDWSAEFKDD